MQNKYVGARQIQNERGAYRFFYYPSNQEHFPWLREIRSHTALGAICSLLQIPVGFESFEMICNSYHGEFHNIGFPEKFFERYNHENANLEIMSEDILHYLYLSKVIDPHRYFRWTLQTVGLSTFLFRGNSEPELIRSLVHNYRRALSLNVNPDQSYEKLKGQLDKTLKTLFGMSGLKLDDLASYGFVEAVHLHNLADASRHTVNKYRRAA